MRELFSIMEGAGDGYNKGFSRIVRPSVRGIIICGKKLVLGYSTGCGAYEIPGGGIEAGETHFEALRREIREELGISIADNTITEFGAVHRIAQQHSDGNLRPDELLLYLRGSSKQQ